MPRPDPLRLEPQTIRHLLAKLAGQHAQWQRDEEAGYPPAIAFETGRARVLRTTKRRAALAGLPDARDLYLAINRTWLPNLMTPCS